MLSYHLAQHTDCNPPQCLEGQCQVLLEQYLLHNVFQARNDLIMLNLPRIRKVVKSVISNTRLELSDVCQSVVVELIPLIDRYDIQGRVPFVAFSHFRIVGTVVDIMRSADPISRRKRALVRLYYVYTSRLGKQPSKDEFESLYGSRLNDRVWSDVFTESQRSGNYFFELRQNEDTDELERRLSNSLEANYKGLDLDYIWAVAKRVCPEREMSILELYYHQGLTLDDIGPLKGCSPSRASQLRSKAIRRIKRALDIRTQSIN